jgi:hypothetical protein
LFEQEKRRAVELENAIQSEKKQLEEAVLNLKSVRFGFVLRSRCFLFCSYGFVVFFVQTEKALLNEKEATNKLTTEAQVRMQKQEKIRAKLHQKAIELKRQKVAAFSIFFAFICSFL